MPPLEDPASSALARLVLGKKVLVLCGAGGVGKTTTSAAIALAGARAGRRVLVLTIDPARRLAQALGIPPASPHPTEVPRDRLAACGVTAGTLDAWMLDPRVIFDRVIRRLGTPESAEAILDSKLYRHMQELVAGMQEYTAAEALYEFTEEGRYDLVVLDTPPSRNALDFLDSPNRFERFLEDGFVQMFLPKEGGLLRRAGRFVGSVFGRVFGDEFIGDLQVFLGAFSGLFANMRRHSAGVRALLGSDDAAFVLVTSPEAEAMREALYFRDQITERGLPFAGFVLNRSLARAVELAHPDELQDGHGLEVDTVRKLAALADREKTRADADAALLDRLRAIAGKDRFAVAAPHLGEAVEDLPGLVDLGRGLGA